MIPVKKFNPPELVQINPESLAIANCYLESKSVEEVASKLGIEKVIVTQYLNRPEVKDYINTVYLDSGYRSRFKLAETLDKLIEQKLYELEEAGVSTSKDILDLLSFAHKIRMDELTALTKYEQAKAQSIKQQTNIQINESFGSTNYTKLIEALTKDASTV